MDYRIGHGYDVHKLVRNRDLYLCGIQIPHNKGLLGHSDADVAVHALCDALLGALALGDIGKLFPDNDEQYKNIYSIILLDKTMQLINDHHYEVGNVDITIIAQKPKLSPYLDSMKNVLAKSLKCETDRISIKATTEEKLGFTGKEKGIAAHCVVLLKEKK